MSCLRKLIWTADFYRDLGVCMPPPLCVCVCMISAYAYGRGGTYIFLYVYVGVAAGTCVGVHVDPRG